MKYYIYISDTKVDMLLSQIPHEAKKKIATELKFDLKVLSASRKSETDQEDNRFTRLEAVVTFIREYGNIGTVDEPDEYIDDVLPMRWGPYGNLIEQTPLVYFGGLTERTIVGLGGSMKHVIGSVGDAYALSASITPILVSYLEKQLGLPLDVPEDYPLNIFPPKKGRGEAECSRPLMQLLMRRHIWVVHNNRLSSSQNDCYLVRMFMRQGLHKLKFG